MGIVYINIQIENTTLTDASNLRTVVESFLVANPNAKLDNFRYEE